MTFRTHFEAFSVYVTRALALGCVRPVYAVPLVALESAAASPSCLLAAWTGWLKEEEEEEASCARVCVAVEVCFSKTRLRLWRSYRSGVWTVSVLKLSDKVSKWPWYCTVRENGAD